MAAILTNQKLPYLRNGLTDRHKFCMMTHIYSLNRACSLKIDFLIIQDGGWHHFWGEMLIRHNSATLH